MSKKEHRIGIIMNGVTGRMGTNQHLMRSIVEIIKQGGVKISETETIMPDPILVGRNMAKLEEISKLSGIKKISTELDSLLADSSYEIYFDSQTTDRRAECVKKAIKAGKHIYCEKPVAVSSQEAMDLYWLAEKAGVKNGVVQDKLWLPGLVKLKKLIDSGFFGKIISVKTDFGYWVFEGFDVPSQRPSWNSRKEDGGGIVSDMFAHWQYVIENLFGQISSVSCIAATQIDKRIDEKGKTFNCTAEDAAYSTFILKNGIIAHFNSSWCTRVRRDDLFSMQVDGTGGSAVVGLRKCRIQPAIATPLIVWNPDIENPENYYEDWIEYPDTGKYDNAFKVQWELFLKHIVCNTPFRWNIMEGAKGVQLSEKSLESWQKKKVVELPPL